MPENPGTLLHYSAYRAIEFLARSLPVPLEDWVANFAAGAYYRLDTRARECLIANFTNAFPNLAPFEIRALVRKSLGSFARYLREFIGGRNISPEFLDNNLTITGAGHITAALKLGRGAIFCSGHYSNWELGCPGVARLGHPITAIVQEHSRPEINALFVERRGRIGVKVVGSQRGPLNALRALRRNETVAILGDRPTGGPVVRVPFFGRETEFPQGPWRLARLSGAPLIPTFVRRERGGYILDFGPAIEISSYNEETEAVRVMAQEWARRFEARVRGDPSQWSAFYPVWSLNESR